jgi:transcriptional regulator GlxA family with amidase domain
MSPLFSPSDEVVDITLLVLPEVSLLSLAATLEPLRAANRASGRNLFRWKLVSPDGGPVTTSSGVPLGVQDRLDPWKVDGALIVLAAFNVDRYLDSDLLGRLRKIAKKGIPIGAVEAGSWVLASAGLLDGRSATTHWEDLDRFAAAFAEIAVKPDRFVIDGNRFTTGGASPALDMALYLIRKRHGYSLALEVASIFIYEEVRTAADPQRMLSLGTMTWQEPRLSKAIKIMEANIEEPLLIRDIAKRVGLKERMLELLFKKVIGVSPRTWYLNLRLKAGRRLVLDTRQSITEIAAQTGFGSASAFARQFKATFGVSPVLARKRTSPL